MLVDLHGNLFNMKTTYRIEITYSSDDLKRQLEPYIDKEIEKIKKALEAQGENNTLTIDKL